MCSESFPKVASRHEQFNCNRGLPALAYVHTPITANQPPDGHQNRATDSRANTLDPLSTDSPRLTLTRGRLPHGRPRSGCHWRQEVQGTHCPPPYCNRCPSPKAYIAHHSQMHTVASEGALAPRAHLARALDASHGRGSGSVVLASMGTSMDSTQRHQACAQPSPHQPFLNRPRAPDWARPTPPPKLAGVHARGRSQHRAAAPQPDTVCPCHIASSRGIQYVSHSSALRGVASA